MLSAWYLSVFDCGIASKQHPRLHALFFQDGDYEALGPEERARAELAWSLLFNWYESLVLQHGLFRAVPPPIIEHWMTVLREDLRQPVIRRLWEQQGHYYHPRLRACVARELSAGDLRAPRSPADDRG